MARPFTPPPLNDGLVEKKTLKWMYLMKEKKNGYLNVLENFV